MNTIGKLAKAAGVGVETIRFYERKGLLKQPKKPKLGSFRSYSDEDAIKIQFIKRTQELGFTLREVKDFLEMNSNGKATLGDVLIKIQAKVSQVNSKIADLKKIRSSLREMEAACASNPSELASCQIAESLSPATKKTKRTYKVRPPVA